MLPDGSCTPATRRAMSIILKQARSEATSAARAQRQALSAKLHQAVQDRAAARGLLRELAERERGIAEWHRFKGRVKPDKAMGRTSSVTKRKSVTGTGTPSLRTRPSAPTASSWTIDRSGFRGVIWQQSYLGRKSEQFRRGAAKARWEYECRDEAVLRDADGEPIIITNMGDDMMEVGTAWQCLEDASIRKNAKIQIRVIAPFDADASPEEMATALRHFCSTVLQPFDLPFSAVIHEPSPEGDQRNYHGHISFSLRPMRRVEPYTFEVANEVRTELDGKAGVQMFRHLWAHSMTEAAALHGRDMQYTGLGYGARGLDHESGEHLGEALTAIARRGQHVPALARNQIKAAQNHIRSRLLDLEKKIAALSSLRDVIAKDAATADAKVPRTILVSPQSPIQRPLLKPASVAYPQGSRPRLEAAKSPPTPQLLTAAAPARRSGNPLKLSEACPPIERLRLSASTSVVPRVSLLKATPEPTAPTRPARLTSVPHMVNHFEPLRVSAPPEVSRGRLTVTQPIPENRPRLTDIRTRASPDPIALKAKEILTQLRRAARTVADAASIHDVPMPSTVPTNATKPALTTASNRPAPMPAQAQPQLVPPVYRRTKRPDKRKQRRQAEVSTTLASRDWFEQNPQQVRPSPAQRRTDPRLALIDRIVEMDAYIAVTSTGLTLDRWVLPALGDAVELLNDPGVQKGLAIIRASQQQTITLAIADFGIVTGSGLSIPPSVPDELRARLDRWSEQDGFSEDLVRKQPDPSASEPGPTSKVVDAHQIESSFRAAPDRGKIEH